MCLLKATGKYGVAVYVGVGKETILTKKHSVATVQRNSYFLQMCLLKATGKYGV